MSASDPTDGSSAAKYARVFQPFQIGKVRLKNRIFVPAHTTNFGEDFLPTPRHVEYHRARARGGVGLIIVEPLRVHRTSLGRAGGLSGSDHRAIPGLRAITEAVHAENIPIFVQLTHAGRHGDNFVERLPAWGPSSIPWAASGDVPHAMTRGEIAEVVRSYADAAEIAVEAGFDGMEIHFGHGHLLHQFLSPLSNDRTDDYGGSDENRLRFPVEVLHAVVERLNGRVPFGVRLSVDELQTGGLDADASRDIAARVASSPGVDFINASVSSYSWPSIGYHVADMNYPPHLFLDPTVRLRDVIGGVPLMTAMGYRTLADAEQALATGAIDLVGMARAHIADPDLIRKTLEGREHEVRPCVAHNFCIEQIAFHRPITCMMNPRAGLEGNWPSPAPRTTHSKRVLVVGGGPAGMEAARVAAERGHATTLWEKSDTLGGALGIAGTGVGRADLNKMRAHLERGLAASGADVETGKDADAKSIAAFGADVVILAIGAEGDHAARPGLASALTVDQALASDRNDWRGTSVAIWDETGSWAALSAAETLAAAGAAVTLLCKPETPLWDINIYSRMIAQDRLRAADVLVRGAVYPVRSDNGLLVVREMSLGREVVFGPFHRFVVALRGRSQLALMTELQDRGIDVRAIGDAAAPRNLLQATYEAHATARQL